jgi:HSP20 family protein
MNTCCSPMTRSNPGATTNDTRAKSATAEKFYRPAIDVVETGDAYIIHADVPGATAGSIDLSFEKGVLTVTASVPPRERAGASALRREYGVGSYRRSFQLGDSIDSNAIGAELHNGVLTITLPKAAEQRARKIEVRHN